LDTPPYYGIKCGVDIITTHGGIKINHKMEVLKEQNIPIKGLFAAGVDTGGTESNTYNFYLSGHAFGFSVYTGRISGENAAKYTMGIDY
jgi:fumarate reductase flavoprotein subunit